MVSQFESTHDVDRKRGLRRKSAYHLAMKKKSAGLPMTNDAQDVRLDVWLWSVRFFKTRALAKQAIEGGKVEVNGAAGKPARSMRVGDRLKITRGEDRFEVEVVALIERRGSAPEAQRCYAETELSRTARETAARQRSMERAGYSKPPTKPDKRARRLIRALGDIDAL
jgi:ribosome-associated heat shock protein Hsp15